MPTARSAALPALKLADVSGKGTQAGGLTLPAGQRPLTFDPSKIKPADMLAILTHGHSTQAIDPELANTLQDTPGVKTLVEKFGVGNLSNILNGTMRGLSTLKGGQPAKLQNYTRQVLDSTQEIGALSGTLKAMKSKGQLPGAMKAFAAKEGKDLYTVLGERVTDPNQRANLLKTLPPPLGTDKLKYYAFLESLAVADVYSENSGKGLNTLPKTDDKLKGGVPSKVLEAFGYSAGDNITGGWGLDMRVFTPKDKNQPIIIAMRGTEGVAIDTKKNLRGTIDSAFGDLALNEPGVNQFEPNKALLDPVVQAALKSGQKIMWVGHSLGGALAQEGAAAYPEATKGVTTFQGANISQTEVDKVKAYNKAHPNAPVNATHFRVEGDSVPTSGSAALPGTIYYNDYVSKPAGAPGPMKRGTVTDLLGGLGDFAGKDLALSAAAKLPGFSVSSASAGHVIPSVGMMLRQQAAGSNDPQVNALLKYGPKDPAALGARPSESAVVYGGKYSAAKDPRLNMEAQRQDVLPKVMALGQVGKDAFEQSAPFSNAQEILLASLPSFKKFEDFQAYAGKLASQDYLAMTPKTLAMAKQMELDQSPRANAKKALNDLGGINAWSAAGIGLTALPKLGQMAQHAGALIGHTEEGKRARTALTAFSLLTPVGNLLNTAGGVLATQQFQKTMNTRYEDIPVLEKYKTGKDGTYQVKMDIISANALRDQSYLKTLWDMSKLSGEIRK